MSRNRLRYLFGCAIVVALGLASRRYAAVLPTVIARYAGDTLWAVMAFGVIGIVVPRWSSLRVALAALTVSYAFEVSQLYHAPWIDAIRDTRLGALALGSDFIWSDLLCYAAGVALCIGLEEALNR